jgi:hypothetical protein
MDMSADTSPSEDREAEEDVPEYEGQVIFKGDFDEDEEEE